MKNNSDARRKRRASIVAGNGINTVMSPLVWSTMIKLIKYLGVPRSMVCWRVGIWCQGNLTAGAYRKRLAAPFSWHLFIDAVELDRGPRYSQTQISALT